MKTINKTTVILFTIMLSCSFTGVKAQKLSYAIKFGLPVSTIKMKDRVYTHITANKPLIWYHYFISKAGFNISLNIKMPISKNFYAAIEPGYILKGAKFSDAASKLDLHYFTLPLLINYKPGKRSGLSIGPEFSILAKAKLDYNGNIIDMNDFYNDNIETSIYFGFSYNISKNLRAGVGFNQGITIVSETEWYTETGNLIGAVKERNQYYIFSISYNISPQ